MARLFRWSKKKTKTVTEYLEAFEDLMAGFETFADKTKLFEKLVAELDLAFYAFGGEKTMDDHFHLIEEKIGRSLTDDEKIKIEILVNASKSKFVISKNSGMGPIWISRRILVQKHQGRRNVLIVQKRTTKKVLRKTQVLKKTRISGKK